MNTQQGRKHIPGRAMVADLTTEGVKLIRLSQHLDLHSDENAFMNDGKLPGDRGVLAG